MELNSSDMGATLNEHSFEEVNRADFTVMPANQPSPVTTQTGIAEKSAEKHSSLSAAEKVAIGVGVGVVATAAYLMIPGVRQTMNNAISRSVVTVSETGSSMWNSMRSLGSSVQSKGMGAISNKYSRNGIPIIASESKLATSSGSASIAVSDSEAAVGSSIKMPRVDTDTVTKGISIGTVAEKSLDFGLDLFKSAKMSAISG